MQSFRGDVGSVWPCNGASVHEEATEVVQILERLEHWALEPAAKTDHPLRTIVERDANSMTTNVESGNHMRKKGHNKRYLRQCQ